MGVFERQLSVKKERTNQRSNVENGFVSCSSSTSMSVVLELAFLGVYPEKGCEWNDEVFPETNTESEDMVPSSR